MADDLCEVLTHLGVSFDPGQVLGRTPLNVSPRAEVQLDESLRAALDHAEHAAYARYGYTTDESTSPPEPLRRPLPLQRQGLNEAAVHESGHAWSVPLPDLTRFADTEECPLRSMLMLVENGTTLGPAHQLHDDVRTLGGGRLSHWKDRLLFSTSDNSDPNANGRAYDLVCRFPASADGTSLLAESDTGAHL
jgi:hypothetical protein